jgi:hypothetical protein
MLNKYKIVKKIYYCNKFYYNVYRKSNNFFKSICENFCCWVYLDSYSSFKSANNRIGNEVENDKNIEIKLKQLKENTTFKYTPIPDHIPDEQQEQYVIESMKRNEKNRKI